MTTFDRRLFLDSTAKSALAGLVLGNGSPVEAAVASRKMKMNLTTGALGLKVTQPEAIELAHRYGFESVEPRFDFLATASDADLARLLDDMKAKKIEFGASGLPIDLRVGDDQLAEQMKRLPAFARTLQRAGVTLVNKPIFPTHDTLTYLANFKQHVERVRQIAVQLGDRGLRLGLEYIGPRTLWASRRYTFIHSMAECRELIAEVGRRDVGLALDSWHWHTARDTEADLLSLKKEEIVSVDINDAPAGIPVDQQVDNRRELPLATGVIDLAAFLNAIHKLGWEGPVRAEPFSAELRKLSPEQAVAATAQAMKKAFDLLR